MGYVEVRYGFKYYDFPWKIKEFFQTLIVVSVTIVAMSYAFTSYARWAMQNQDKSNNPPRLNDMSKNPDIALKNDILGVSGARNYSNSPFYWDNNHGKYGQQIYGNSYETEPLPNTEIQKDDVKEKKSERIEREKETRKRRRERIQKEHNDGKIAHRIYVLRERLRVLDSEATIVRNEIRRLESKQSPPSE